MVTLPHLAVTGAACRLPGVTRAVELGDDPTAASPFAVLPDDRWSARVFGGELADHAATEMHGALLPSYDVDWRSLNLPPLQAERMHRMERLALAAMAEALADAGVTRGQDGLDRCSVILAVNTFSSDPMTDHGRRVRRFELAAPVTAALARLDVAEADEINEIIDHLFNIAAPPVDADSMRPSASVAAGRVANLFGTRGGHLAIDAGMSSSLAALEEAALLVDDGSCDRVVVCAVSPIVAATNLLSLSRAGLLGGSAPRPFQQSSMGTVAGEGVVAMVLEDPEAAGARRVYAVVEAVGAGAAPFRGQPSTLEAATSEASIAALESWGGDPDEVFGVVSRALGVPLHDRSEALGLARAYAAKRRPGPLRLRSTVGRFGFLHAASGMAALLEAVMSQHAKRWISGSPGVEGGLLAAMSIDGPGEPLPAGARVGVSDAGFASSSFHAIVGPAPTADLRPLRRGPVVAKQPLAIVGAGLIVPQANDLETFWSNILEGVNAITDLPPSRWSVDDMVGTSAEVGSVLKTRLAGVVQVPDVDPGKYGLPPSQRPELDPATLLALVCAENALAGVGEVSRTWDPRRVDVIVGQLPYRWSEMELEKRALFAGHLQLAADAMREAGLPPATVDRVIAEARRTFDTKSTGFTPRSLEALSGSTVPAAVAHAFGFRGRAFSIDAACASSLAAVKLGARRLQSGLNDAVLAGATAFNLLPEYYVSLSMLGALSPRGAPPFDVGADGFVPAEGAGFVVLRRLDDALRRDEPILSVIRGVGVSSDGRGVSVFAPNVSGQVCAIERALADADLQPEAIDYVEAHGTGTQLGDATELESYGQVYGRRDRSEPLSIGTVKSQLGHQSSAAGIVGLIKTAVALREHILPPSNADTEVRPSLAFATNPFEFARVPRPWTTLNARTRRAAVSAFGLGGINYHLLLEEPPVSAVELYGDEPLGAPTAEPAGGTLADRFEVVTTPLALPARAPSFPLRGRRVLLVPDPGALHLAFEEGLRRRGARCIALDPAEASSVERLVAATEAALVAGGIDVLIDLSCFGPDPVGDQGLERFRDQMQDATARLMAPLSAVYDVFANPERRCCYAVITSLGGDMGLSGGGTGTLLGASALGLCKGMRQELPGLLAKGIDFPLREDPDAIVDLALTEIEDGNDRMEVGYLGRRLVPSLHRAMFDDNSRRVASLVGDGVTLCTGGGRGVVFECAAALARRGERVVVCGRTAPPDIDEPWLNLPRADFEGDLRQQIFREHRTRDGRLTPASFDRRVFGRMRRQRELAANLLRAKEQGLPLSYEVCDITDPAATRAMVERVRARHGRVRVVVHGAMVEWSRSLPRKRPVEVMATLDTKVTGLLSIVMATADDPPETVLCFGSGAGRFGNRGQSDYCAANQLMAATLQRLSRQGQLPGRAMTIDWTAWDEVGAAAEDETIAALVRETGVTSIKPHEGVYWFLSELALGRRGERLICGERLLHTWPGLGDDADGATHRGLPVDDRGAPLLAGRWPMLDWVVERAPGVVVAERRVDVERDLYLPHHRLHGAPIIPATFGCELLAEIAALGSPDHEVESLRAIVIDVPVKLHKSRPILLRARAETLEHAGGVRIVQASTTSHLFLKGQALQADRIHHSGEVRLSPRGQRPVRRVEIPEIGGAARARSFFHLAKDPVGLGPIFCRAEWIFVGDREVTGVVRPPRMRDVLSFTSYPRFQLDPIVLDAAFQIAANWDGYKNGFVSIPLGVDELIVGRPRLRSESVRVWARPVNVDDPDVRYDLVVVGDRDEVVLEAKGLHLRRISKVKLRVAPG